MASELGWGCCLTCDAFVFDSAEHGRCAGGARHDISSSDYVMPYVDGPHSQANWLKCATCQALVYVGSGEAGACPAGGAHDLVGSRRYWPEALSMVSRPHGMTQQSDWRWCIKCQGLAHDDDARPGLCAGGGRHDDSRSGVYLMYFVAPVAVGPSVCEPIDAAA